MALWRTRRSLSIAISVAAVAAAAVVAAVLLVKATRATRKDRPGPPERPGEIGVVALLEELGDLSRLADLPDPPFLARMVSSYDRRSVSPADAEGWFANDDWVTAGRMNGVTVDEPASSGSGRREYVLLDVPGPGAVVRIWTATPTGTLRMYLDGDRRPVLEARTDELLGGRAEIPPSLAYVAARGSTSYFPFPFRQRCKITVDDIIATDPFNGQPLPRVYYQINHRAYPAAVAPRVRTFRRGDFERAAPVIARVGRVLDEPSAAAPPPAPAADAAAADVIAVALAPASDADAAAVATDEAAAAVVDVGGPAAIDALALSVKDLSEEALRRARLTITFDGDVTVDAPLGDFFGTGPGFAPYESLPFTVRADGTMISRWRMPFRRRAEVVVRGSPGVSGTIRAARRPWTERSMTFHARWSPPATAATRPPRDLTLLAVAGRGVYVGNMLGIANPPGTNWWGEGDEKIYVDGEPFPGLFGTGTEDYYGYAWSTPERFSRPLHAQTRADGPGFSGHFSMNRFHVLDAVPFTSAFRFDLELWHWSDTSVTWEAMAYFYARPQ
jgi:hypothetical protein